MFLRRNLELILKITVNFMSQVKTLDGLIRQAGNLDSPLSLFHPVFYQQHTSGKNMKEETHEMY